MREISVDPAFLSGKVPTLTQMATIYASQGLVDQALRQYQEALEITQQIGQYESIILHQIAGIYAQKQEFKQAIVLYKQSLEIKQHIGNVEEIATTLTMLGQSLAMNGEFKTAISNLQEASAILLHLKSPDAATVQSLLEQIQQLAKSPPLQGG